jgi:hypothetical protein
MIVGSRPDAGNGADTNSHPPPPRPDRYPDYVYARDIGLYADEVRRRFPWATEYYGTNGPCWSLADLEGRS